jgi:glycosyltransferase involved in cell wall biosynthesis
MLVLIGVLAHNESAHIGALIADLGNQDILRSGVTIEIHVVANGCTDKTVDIAKNAFGTQPFRHENIRTFVHDVAQAGKSNAWNMLIHNLASPHTDIMFLLDADIRLPENTTLGLMHRALVQSTKAMVAVDESVKDLSLKSQKSLIEKIILAASGTAHDTRKSIAGGLYCARFNVLRSIWMPIGLPGEDGFLRAMILTSNFSAQEDSGRLVFVQGARHVFESERRIRDVFRHNVRLAIGTAINVLLFKHFRAQLAENKNLNIADYVRERNAVDPNWINELIQAKVEEGNYFVMERRFALRRLQWFSALSIGEQVRKAPLFLMGLVFDFLLVLRANQLMRDGAGAGYW